MRPCIGHASQEELANYQTSTLQAEHSTDSDKWFVLKRLFDPPGIDILLVLSLQWLQKLFLLVLGLLVPPNQPYLTHP
jgi:hypothetical protein